MEIPPLSWFGCSPSQSRGGFFTINYTKSSGQSKEGLRTKNHTSKGVVFAFDFPNVD